MPRIPIPGLRGLVPRVSLISRPLLPLTSRLATASSQTPASLVAHSRWRPQFRMFAYTPVRANSQSPPSSPSSSQSHGPGPNASFSQRLKYLIKSYGWYALGVYILISTLDFGVAFAAVNILGAEHVSRLTSVVKDYFMSLVHSTPSEPGKQELEHAPPEGGREGLYAMIVLAYTVHKTLFLPVRVGLTAAVTPRLVGWLRTRGWAGGEGTKRAAREMRDRVRRGRDSD